jgi:hypothetical protein
MQVVVRLSLEEVQRAILVETDAGKCTARPSFAREVFPWDWIWWTLMGSLIRSIAGFAMTTTPLALSCGNSQARQPVATTPQYPPAGQFPADVSLLERAELEEIYRRLRFHYRGVMISRGIYRNRCNRQVSQLQDAAGQLRLALSERSSEKVQAYAVLERITGLVQVLEADGDALVESYQDFRSGGHRYGGAPRIGKLIQSVIGFINNWQRHKQAFRQVMAAQQQVPAALAPAGESLDACTATVRY